MSTNWRLRSVFCDSQPRSLHAVLEKSNVPSGKDVPQRKRAESANQWQMTQHASSTTCYWRSLPRQPLFLATNLKDQRQKLIRSLTVVVQSIDYTEELTPTLANLRGLGPFGKPWVQHFSAT